MNLYVQTDLLYWLLAIPLYFIIAFNVSCFMTNKEFQTNKQTCLLEDRHNSMSDTIMIAIAYHATHQAYRPHRKSITSHRADKWTSIIRPEGQTHDTRAWCIVM